MPFVQITLRILFLLLVINVCSGNFHAPLYRVSIPYTISDYNGDVNAKSIQNSPHKLVNLMHTKLDGNINMGYYISLGIGTPPQKFNLILDTGSSNTGVAGVPQKNIKRYFDSRVSSTYVDYGINVNLPYDSGSWKGSLGSDIFTFDGIFSIGKNQTTEPLKLKSNFTVITSSHHFFLKNSDWEGILGLAYSVLSQPNDIVNKNTLFDNLVQSTRIPDMFSVILCGHNKEQSYQQTQGFFIAGGMNTSLFTPPMVNILIRRKWFYEIIISAISINNKPIIISSCKEYNNDKTILDTGTTDTLLPTHVFRSLVQSIINHMRPHPFLMLKSSPFWDRKAVLCTFTTNTSPPPAFFPEVHFDLVINDTASLRLALSPQQYISYIGDKVDIFGVRNCYKFAFGESRSGTILGDSFLEGFYLLFNRANGTVGIAQSVCNSHYPSMLRSRLIRVYNDQGGLLSCGIKSSLQRGLFGFVTSSVTIIIGLVFGMVLIIALIMMLILQWRDNDPNVSMDAGRTPLNIPGTRTYRSLD